MTTTEASKPQRAYVSDVSLNIFGTTVLAVDVVSIKTKSEDLTTICPDCKEPHKLNRMYICGADKTHGPYFEGKKAKEVDKVLYPLTDEQVKAIKAPALEKNVGTVEVFHSAQVEAATRPGDGAYRLRPHDGKAITKALYASITQVVASQSDKAFIFELNMKDHQSLYRLTAWNGQLVAQKLLRADELAPVDVIDAAPIDRMVAQLTEFAQVDVADFFPEAWANKTTEKHRKIAAEQVAAASGASTTKGRKKIDDRFSIEDVMAQLTAGRPKKTTKTRTPKKTTTRKTTKVTALRKAS